MSTQHRTGGGSHQRAMSPTKVRDLRVVVPPEPYDGEDLAAELADLATRRLPLLDPDDPVGIVLHEVLPMLFRELGRPLIEEVL